MSNAKTKAKLAAGAAKIRKLEKAKKGGKKADPPKVEPVVIPESTRPIEEIIKERVTVLPGSIANHVGFMIGDVLNFGMAKFGEKYKAALNQTGRAYSTLAGYAETARRIPASNRMAALTFTHHREILRIGNDEKIATVLREVGAQAEKGNAPTTKELRNKVQKLTPRKKKAPKKATSGKGKKGKSKPEAPPYEPNAEEQSKLDAGEDALSAASDAIKSGGVFKIAAKLDNKEKRRWLALAEPIVVFYNALDRVTGY